MQQNVQQDCFFAHLENLIQAILGDEDKAVRIKAVRRLKKYDALQRQNYEMVRKYRFLNSTFFDASLLQNPTHFWHQ